MLKSSFWDAAFIILTVSVIAVCTTAEATFEGRQNNFLDRNQDPVVVTGDELAALKGIPANNIVGFRFNNRWKQIPIQIDERKYVDFIEVYNFIFPPGFPL